MVPGSSGRSLRAFTKCMLGIDFFDGQRYIYAFAKCLTMRCKIICRSLQAVVNMERTDLTWPFLRTGEKQSCGISATAVANN